MLQSERANVEAARHRIAMKSSLMNPMLMVGVENLPTNSFGFTDEPMTSKMIGVSQSFPFPGKLKAEQAIAAQDTITVGASVNEAQNELARDIKQAYFEIYHLERSIATNEFHVRAIDEMLNAARAKFATGAATQSDVLNLQLERSDIKNQIVDEKTMLAMQRADLERASGADVVNINVTSSLALPLISYSLSELDSLAARHRPILAAMRSEADQQLLNQRRADLNKYPDFQVSLEYMQRDALSATSAMNPTYSPAANQLGLMPMTMKQSDMVSATVSIELPLNYGDQRGEAIAEADAMRSMKLSQERAKQLEIHAELEANLAKLNGLREQYAILRDEIYPVVQQSLETSNANYTYGKAGLEQVLRDQLTLLHREHDRYRLEAEYNKTLAQIEYLTGVTLVHYSSASAWK